MSLNFAAESAMIRWDPAITGLPAIMATAETVGFQLLPDAVVEAAANSDARAARDTLLRLAVAVFFSMNAMVPALGVYAGIIDGMPSRTSFYLALASGAMALPVLVYSAQPFFQGALRALERRVLGMDFLVAAGSSLAFAYSSWQLARGSSEVYFDSASMIVTLLLVGRVIETRARRRGGDAVRELLASAPETVRVLDPDGTEHERACGAVPRGALARVRPGERISIDGVVVAGASAIDRALLTGESRPVAVAVGKHVEAGTINGEGALTVRVTAAAGERAIDGVARAVEGFLSARAPLAALSDRAVAAFVPAVVLLAGIAGVVHGIDGGGLGGGVLRAVSVLVIACPCALGLATPMALLVAAGHAARRGILFRDGEALERAARVDVVLFDKTGTLTEGRPRVVNVQTAVGVSREELLRLAARAESQSEHPISRAIAAAAPLDSSPRDGTLTAHPGLGVEWKDESGLTLVGTERLLRMNGIGTPRKSATDDTSVEVAFDGRWIGRIDAIDTLRATTPGALDELRRMGMRLGMLTGDAPGPADAIARELNLCSADVEVDCSPAQKADAVVRRRTYGSVVAFVGDGLNDTAALAAAGLAVAATGATDLAMRVAHLALREGGIARLPDALVLARRTREVMLQNIAWALGYNVVALPIAVVGFAPPAVAALAMALSSITVLGNSLRLIRP